MRILLTTFTLAALTAQALPAAAQVYPERIRSVATQTRVERYQRGSGEEATDKVSKTFRLAANGEVDLSNIAGDIIVSRGGGNDVTIEVLKRARARTPAEAREALQMVQVDLVERAGRIEARTQYPRGEDVRRRGWRGVNVSVQYTVTTPERTRLIANSVSGNLVIRDVKGDLSLETVSGDVKIGNAGRISKAKTASGDVEIADTTIEGTMDASTISGAMLLRNVKARQLDVGSISGPVVIDNVNCERIDAQSISGDVRFTGPLVRGGRYDLGSHSGEVRVIISGSVGFELEASSFSGTVRSDLELKGADAQPANRRRGGSRAVRGTYGDGSAFLELTSFSGSVIVGGQ